MRKETKQNGSVRERVLKKTMDLHKELLSNFLPTKTFLFLLPVSEINKRLKKRKITNKYDKIDTLFHSKVISGYKKLSKNNKRFVKINADLNVDKIHETVLNSKALWIIQVQSFQTIEEAMLFAESLKRMRLNAYIVKKTISDTKIYRVRVYSNDESDNLENAVNKLEKKGYKLSIIKE